MTRNVVRALRSWPCPIAFLGANLGYFRQAEPVIRSFTTIYSTCRRSLFHSAVQLHLRLVLLCVTIVSYGTQAILAETARTRVEGAIRRLTRWRAAGWKNLPLSGSPQIGRASCRERV